MRDLHKRLAQARDEVAGGGSADRVARPLVPAKAPAGRMERKRRRSCAPSWKSSDLKRGSRPSGSKGLQHRRTVAPRLDFGTVKDFAQTVVVHLARTIPSRFVAKIGVQNRKGKFFVDYPRKGHSQTTAAAFSAPARPGLGVSMPISREDLSSIESGSQWSIQMACKY